MPEELTLRIRHPKGISTINNLTNFSTISDLKHEISSLIKSNPNDLILRVGYPPAPVFSPDETHLTDAQIASGDTIIVELQELEESKSQSKSNTSDQKKELSEKPNEKTSQQASQQRQQPINTQIKPEPEKKIEIPDMTNRIQVDQRPSASNNDHAQHFAMTEEEFDAQLARALQE